MDRANKAQEYFYKGYTCSQSIVLAFSDLVNVSEDVLKKVSLPFGGGLGRLRLTCGAISGMAIIIGLLFSDDVYDENNKANVYSMIQDVTKVFNKKYKTLKCSELLKQASVNVEVGGLPEERTEEYYKKRPCGKVIYEAAIILEEFLKNKGII